MHFMNDNIQGWMSQMDLAWLYHKAVSMESIVEIGCWKGRSTYSLCSGCKGMVYVIDHFQGSGEPEHIEIISKLDDPDGIYKIFMENMKGFSNLKVFKERSQLAAISFPKKSIDMIFIDGDHSYSEVLLDIQRWLPKTKKLICGHDIEHPPVRKAVIEVFGNNYGISDGNIWYHEVIDESK